MLFGIWKCCHVFTMKWDRTEHWGPRLGPDSLLTNFAVLGNQYNSWNNVCKRSLSKIKVILGDWQMQKCQWNAVLFLFVKNLRQMCRSEWEDLLMYLHYPSLPSVCLLVRGRLVWARGPSHTPQGRHDGSGVFCGILGRFVFFRHLLKIVFVIFLEEGKKSKV